ncbi:MAG: bifunctional folylpolyglutamate synthase/dihydrofolate synthase [Armatimonadota bacterium]
MTYSEAVAYLDSLAQFGWKLDLARIERLCELAGHPERRFPSILVGGSAGKGSTCALLSAILRAAGLRVGTAPKPHLHTHRERVQIDGELIPAERFAELMARIRPLAEQVTREEGSPTVFEVMTLLSFLQFAEERVDVAVVEVGLGGRFDATNVLTPEVAVITTIGLDHTDRLGDTVEQIAFEKAGIIKPAGRVVTGAVGGALEVIETAARERGAEIRRLGHEVRLENVRASAAGTQFDLLAPEGELCDLLTQLAGEHQAHNAALAVAAALWLRPRWPVLTDGAIRRGLRDAAIPGRLQVVRAEPLVLVDGAHSPDRADALARALRQLYLPGRAGRVTLVIGCSQGHAPAEVVSRLAPLADRILATRSRHPAAISAADVAEAVRNAPPGARARVIEAVEPVSAAVERALADAGPGDTIVVTGSLFAAGEALETLGAEPRDRLESKP